MMPSLLTSALVLVVALLQPAQPDPAALFDRGVTWEQFLSTVRPQRDRWVTNAGRAAPSTGLVDRLKRVSPGLRILVIAEGACSDSVSTLPYLAVLADRAGVELRIVGRDDGRAIMEQHRTPDDRAATPTIVLVRDRQVAGVWVERPAALQAWFLSPAARALGTQERVSRKMSWYDWDRGDSTMAEIVALAEAGSSR